MDRFTTPIINEVTPPEDVLMSRPCRIKIGCGKRSYIKDAVLTKTFRMPSGTEMGVFLQGTKKWVLPTSYMIEGITKRVISEKDFL